MTCAEAYAVRAMADAELARQYALAREMREHPDQVEHVQRATIVIPPSDDPRDRGYWTPERIGALRKNGHFMSADCMERGLAAAAAERARVAEEVAG